MRIQPEKEREGEGERERERFDMGETSLSSDWPILYCPERPFILMIVHRDQWIIQNYVALAAQTLSVYLCIQKISGDLHYLLAC